MFANPEALHAANVFSLRVIDTFSGARSGKIKENFYDDYQDTLVPVHTGPPAKERDVVGRLQNKADEYYTRGRHNCDTLHRTTSVFLDIQFERIQTLLSCSHKM